MMSTNKNFLHYKGYIGFFNYDSDGKIFTGEVFGLKTIITFQGRTGEELEASLKESVDMYLSMCKEDGVSPEKPFSGKFNVRIPPELHKEIAGVALSEKLSINDWVIHTFEKAIHQK